MRPKIGAPDLAKNQLMTTNNWAGIAVLVITLSASIPSKAFAQTAVTLENRVTAYYITTAEFEAQGDRSEKPRRAKKVTVAKTRNMRFGEFLVVKKDFAEVYNTTGLNDCPDKLWNAMDMEKLAKELRVTRVQKNGPKYWMMDSQTLILGEKASFGGIEGRWAATLPTALLGKEGAAPYKIFNPKKTQRMVYSKGKPVYELVDPDGHAYVLQARGSRITLDSLPKLGKRMTKLPQGWKYRTRVLTEDLVLNLTPDKTIYGVGDEFHQYYTRIPADE